MKSFDEVVRERRSVRAFDPNRCVSRQVLREVLELAARAPSNCNAQPWRVFAVEGERCNRLRQRLHEAAAAGTAVEEKATPAFEGIYRARQIACAVELYTQLGVSRHDKQGRQDAALRNFEFFDAPHVLVLCMDDSFGLGVALDVGAYLQTLLLAMQSRGIASCAQAAIRSYSSIVSDELGIPNELRVLCGISYGYEVKGAAANRVFQDRSPVDEHVTFID